MLQLAEHLDDGTLKKIDGRVTNDTGSFSFRLTPDPAKYRITAKADHMQPASKDVLVDSAILAHHEDVFGSEYFFGGKRIGNLNGHRTHLSWHGLGG